MPQFRFLDEAGQTMEVGRKMFALLIGDHKYFSVKLIQKEPVLNFLA